MTGLLARIPAWYWLLLGLWTTALVSAAIFYTWYVVLILLVGFVVVRPLIGIPLALAALSPLLALPFALRRPKLTTE